MPLQLGIITYDIILVPGGARFELAERARPVAVGASEPGDSRVLSLPARTPWMASLLADAAARSLVLAGAAGALVLVVDVPLSLVERHPVRAALGVGSFGVGMAAVLAPPLALVQTIARAVSRRLLRHRGVERALTVLTLLAMGGLVGVPPGSNRIGVHLAAVAAFTAVTAGLLSASRARPLLRRGACLLVAGGALAFDLLEPKSIAPELHRLACLVTVLAALVGARTLQRRLAGAPRRRLHGTLMAVVAVGIALMASTGATTPEWRRAAAASSRYTGRMLVLARALTDLDRDGFSPLAWGGDCDDLDGHRHPLARDRPGAGDLNCNGIDPPRSPSDEERGLAPPAGDPDLPPGAAKLVLLITVDCLRDDSLTPAMPALAERARRGLRLERLYAGGTRTMASMPLINTGGPGRPLAARLREAGVLSTVVLGVNFPKLEAALGPGAGEVIIDHTRVGTSAEAVNAAVLPRLDAAVKAPGRRFFWIHYFDAHSPSTEVLPPATPGSLSRAREHYHAGLGRIDRAIAEVLQRLEQSGALARTVVVVTGDHGEAFGEHGIVLHVVSGYEPVVHVPGVMFAPGLAPGLYHGLASHRDIYATVLGAFGLVHTDPDAERFGRSWLRLRAVPDAPLHRFVAVRTHQFMSGGRAFQPMLVLIDERHKLIKALTEAALWELYDLGDTAEERDLAFSDAPTRLRLDHQLERFRDIDQWP
jgi:hypothetical protein